MEIENKEKNSFNYIEIGLYVVIIIAALIILVTINSFKVPSSNANNNSLYKFIVLLFSYKSYRIYAYHFMRCLICATV